MNRALHWGGQWASGEFVGQDQWPHQHMSYVVGVCCRSPDQEVYIDEVFSDNYRKPHIYRSCSSQRTSATLVTAAGATQQGTSNPGSPWSALMIISWQVIKEWWRKILCLVADLLPVCPSTPTTHWLSLPFCLVYWLLLGTSVSKYWILPEKKFLGMVVLSATATACTRNFLTVFPLQPLMSLKGSSYDIGFLCSWSSQLSMMSSLQRRWLVSPQVCQEWREMSLLFLQKAAGKRSSCAMSHCNFSSLWVTQIQKCFSQKPRSIPFQFKSISCNHMYIFQLPVHLNSPLFNLYVLAATDVTRNQFLLGLTIAHKTLQLECLSGKQICVLHCLYKQSYNWLFSFPL